MSEIIFILGGARSGKSNYALKLAQEKAKKVVFLATCEALDEEMKARIEKHRLSRPKQWQTLESARDLDKALKHIPVGTELAIIDCLTLFVSNLLLKGLSAEQIIGKVKKILVILRKKKLKAIMVANEVGLGIVPDNALARNFRDIAGMVNQSVAKEADRVLFMAAGLPLELKIPQAKASGSIAPSLRLGAN